MDADDQPSQEIPNHEQEQGTSQATSSYECTFCKRGFSNAQALGGHMNIHRKDKAKLKHSSNNESRQSSDTPKINPSFSPAASGLMESMSGTDEGSIKWPFIVDAAGSDDHGDTKRDGDQVGKIQKLRFSYQKSPSTEDHQDPSSQVHGISKKSNLSSSSEIDLELRLWPEPQDSGFLI
ncbi:hypothetical protein SADUNF_Sadunf09G0027900 [Salix dunnii]|uniref:C2H2-type domain-containing protein n=1 Tax=Salix dunnii TaxID=1413687 RepID=A0A835MRW5_9ROSI|nr:hypothetical protein SADUNF_Sadunf09G0027900 [Salix dunnii]